MFRRLRLRAIAQMSHRAGQACRRRANHICGVGSKRWRPEEKSQREQRADDQRYEFANGKVQRLLDVDSFPIRKFVQAALHSQRKRRERGYVPNAFFPGVIVVT